VCHASRTGHQLQPSTAERKKRMSRRSSPNGPSILHLHVTIVAGRLVDTVMVGACTAGQLYGRSAARRWSSPARPYPYALLTTGSIGGVVEFNELVNIGRRPGVAEWPRGGRRADGALWLPSTTGWGTVAMPPYLADRRACLDLAASEARSPCSFSTHFRSQYLPTTTSRPSAGAPSPSLTVVSSDDETEGGARFDD
jgi:hypothetical protein